MDRFNRRDFLRGSGVVAAAASLAKPIRQHGFTIAGFAPDKIVLRLFKWDVET